MEIFRLFGSVFIQDEEARRGLTNVDEHAGRVSGTLSKLAGLAAGLGGVLAAGLAVGSIVSGVSDLQQSVHNFQMQTGTANEQMGEFQSILTDIYNDNFGESFDDISKSMATVKQITGESGNELKKLTEHALTLRDTFEFDVNETTRTANSLMKQFGISGDQAMTLIAQGAQNGANKNGDLLDTLNEYAPQFKALGFSAEEFTDILIQGAAEGAFSIDKVGDAVKEFNIRAKDGSKSTTEAFQALGMDAGRLTKEFAAGGSSAQEAFKKVISALNEVQDPVKKNQIGVQLFGTQFEDLEAKAITSMVSVQKVANSSADTLEQINKVKYDNIESALKGIGRNIQTAIIVPISEKVLPKLSELSNWFVQKTPEIKTAIESGIGVASDIFDKLSAAIKFVIDNGNILLPVITGLTAAIAAQAAVEKVIALYKLWSAATKTQTTVQWLLNAAMAANPIGWIALAIGAVIAAGVALYMNWDKVVSFLKESWEWMKQAALGLVDFFGGWGPTLLVVLTGPFGLIVAMIIKYWDQIKAYTAELWNSVLDFFKTDVPAGFNSFIDFVSEIPGKVYAFMSDLFIDKIPYAVGYAIGWMIQAFTDGIPKVIQFFKDLPVNIWTWLVKVYEDLEQWRGSMVERAAHIGSTVITAVVDFFKELPGRIWEWLQEVVSRLVGFGSDAKHKAGEIGRGIVDGMIDFVKTLPDRMGEFLDIAVDKVLGVAKRIKDSVTGIFKNGYEGIKAGLGGGSATITIPAYATGTSYATGGLSLVGEEGPELVNLPRGAQVTPNDRTEQLLGGGMPGVIQTIVQIDSRNVVEATSRPANDRLSRNGRGAGWSFA